MLRVTFWKAAWEASTLARAATRALHNAARDLDVAVRNRFSGAVRRAAVRGWGFNPY